jgi:fibro-slime domain-containing protein
VLRWLLAGTGCIALLGASAGGCGARTELALPPTCNNEGEERACRTGCGSGSQTCSNGLWENCLVPETTRGCTNVCGSGAQSCRDGVWGTCEVAPVERACFTECGQGVERCIDADWRECDVPDVQRPCSSVCGDGNETCRFGRWGKCDAPQPRPPELKATIRDFSPKAHPDFEADYPGDLDEGVVQPLLGMDDKPVYAGMPVTKSTSGAVNFFQWFHDDPTVNQTAVLPLPLLPAADQPGLFEYVDLDFFPIDDQLIGNEGRNHNYHFTLEASTTFEYRGGELFSFEGDDDMWVFINRRLAIDLGGLHNTLRAQIELDAIAPSFGLQKGTVYPLHFFFAERHTIASHFAVRTTIAEPGSCE